jgi:hypothetical protein
MAASMLPAAGRRPARGALLTVSLGRAESEEWFADAAFRRTLTSDVARRARDKGRRFFEIYDHLGARIGVGESGAS